MSKELANFFAELSANPLLVEKFEANPNAMLGETELSEQEKQLILTRDLRTISNQLMANGPTGTEKKKANSKKKANKKKANKKK
jgi:hypothetical protein